MTRDVSAWWVVLLLPVSGVGGPTMDARVARAAQAKDLAAVELLVRQHADVNIPLPDGATAIAWAAHWDDVRTADVLIRAGANVNLPNDAGATPLWLACSIGSAPMVDILLRAGANPNAAHLPAGETALVRCAATGSVDAVKALLDHDAAIDGREKAGQTPLMWAIEERHQDVARLLIDRGADVNAASEGGFTPLMFAARQGDLESGRLLLAKGANLNVSSRIVKPSGSAAPGKGLLWFYHLHEALNPLTVAIHGGHEQFAIFILEQGADPNALDAHGLAPLHYALQAGLSSLNGVGHDPRYGALDFLFRPNMTELVSALLKHGANPNVRIAKRVSPLTRTDRPNINLTGATPFVLAAAAGDVSTMKILLDAGADPLLPTDDGTTAMMAAAGISRAEDRTKEEERMALEAVKLILSRGGSANTINLNGLTAIHGAAYTGADEIIAFLAEHGAQLNVPDKFGETPLSIAAGDPNGLAEHGERLVGGGHKSTAALLRKLTGDHASLIADPQVASLP